MSLTCRTCGSAHDPANECRESVPVEEQLRASLELIAAGKGKCIYSHSPEFREGSAAAFEQMAEVAISALAKADGSAQ